MTIRVLTLRELNRATLERQLLLERTTMTTLESVGRLVALQSQIPNPPYIGLWTRLKSFAKTDLTGMMEAREIVRYPMLRSTLHLTTAEDHQQFRMTIQPALERGFKGFYSKPAKILDQDKLVTAIRPHMAQKPLSMKDIREILGELEPEQDANAMSYAIRTFLPVIQVPPSGTWGVGSKASYVTATQWLGELDTSDNLWLLFLRYLRGYGPASIMDFQKWLGMTSLKKRLESSLAELVVYHNEDGKELFDLPDMPLPTSDILAPVRFIPEYDNLLISHADRRRVIADEHRGKVFLTAGRIAGTILLDGFVAGTWKVNSERKSAILNIMPFDALSDDHRQALTEEGTRLLGFVAEDIENYQISFV